MLTWFYVSRRGIAMHFWISCLVMMFLSASLTASPSPRLVHSLAGSELLLYEDAKGTATVEEIDALPDAAFFRRDQKVPNLGFSRSTYWVRLYLQVPGPADMILEYGYPLADRVQFFSKTVEGHWQAALSGDRVPAVSREILFRNPAFRLEIPANGRAVFYLRVQSDGSLQFPLVLRDLHSFEDHRAVESFLLGGLYLILLAMLIYNMGLYLVSRRPYILPYIVFISCVIIVNFSQQGLNNFIFADFDCTWLNNEGHIFLAGFYSISGTLFAQSFLEIPRKDRISRLFLILPITTGLLTCSTALWSYNIGARIAAVNVLMFGLALSVVVIRANFRKLSYIRYFTFAWTLALLGYMSYALMMASLLPTHMLTVYGIVIGSTVETIFLSLAIGDKIRSELNHLLSMNQNLNQELIAKDQARTLFFQNTSHELRTPLNGIIGYLEFIMEGHVGALTPLLSDKIQKALHLSKGLKFQVNTILDLAKAKKGELKLVQQELNLTHLKREVDELAEGLAAVSEQISYGSSLQSDGQTYYGDHEKILTVLRNLLGNAFKFRDPDRQHSVQCLIECKAGLLTLRVHDNGIGISTEDQSRIFEEFTQAQGDARRRYEGTGLGLSMVKALVTLMQGEINLISELGSGSTFTVSLPSLIPIASSSSDVIHTMAAPSASTARPAKSVLSSNAAEPTAAKPSSGFTIYVLDDNPYNCEIISDILRTEGHQVRIGMRASQAIEDIRRDTPDLLLLDMMMPDMSGEDVLKYLRSDTLLSHLPVILITARASEEDRLLGLSLGADDYIAKPIVADELRLRVHNLCERHRLRNEAESSMQLSKLAQLGTMFGDLSHELKNVLQGNQIVEPLTKDDSILCLNPVPFSEPSADVLATVLLADRQVARSLTLADNSPSQPKDEHQVVRSRVQQFIGELPLSDSQRNEIWNEVLQFPPEYLYFLATQLKIWGQYLFLWGQMDRCWKLTQAILGMARNSGAKHCQLSSVWPQAWQILAKSFQKNSIRIEAHTSNEWLAIDTSSLLQILMNLSSNALDALVNLPESERWMRIDCHRDDKLLYIDLSNAGHPLPPTVQEHLFQRGFSTKGDKGTGIGLYVSRRLALEAGGDLIYLASSSSPCFRVVLPLHE